VVTDPIDRSRRCGVNGERGTAEMRCLMNGTKDRT
jgi:hypothetical protein